MRLSLRVPATNERGPLFMNEALDVLHQANPHRHPIRFEIGRRGDSLSLALSFPPELRSVVETQLFAQYPDAKIEPSPEEPLPTAHRVWTVDLSLVPDLFPIRRYAQFEDALNRLNADPLVALLSAIPNNRSGSLVGRIEITVRPCPADRRRSAVRTLRTLSRPFFRSHHRLRHLYLALALSRSRTKRILAWMLGCLAPKGEATSHSPALTTSASRSHEREEDLGAASDKLSRLLFEAGIRLIVTAPEGEEAAAKLKLQELAGSFGLFSSPRLAVFHAGQPRVSSEPAPEMTDTFLLSTEELATLWHPSTVTVKAPALATVESREFEPPPTLPRLSDHPDLAVLCRTAFRDQH